MNNSQSNPLQSALYDLSSNPLLAALPPKLADSDLANAMESRPILPRYVAEIPLASRLQLLDQFERIFVVTDSRLRIAKGLQDLLYAGLRARTPTAEAAKQFIYQSGQRVGQPIDALPWNPSSARGMVVEGPTGMGKTHCIDQFLARFPQVITHGHEPTCGWRALKQLVYLKVHMPADGSRGGFLASAFFEIDAALGTEYLKSYQRWTIEKQLVALLHVLTVHRCGLLIIEEAQKNALVNGAFSAEFTTFFLRILNWRIPTVLVGNPLAFTKIKRFAQDVDRFSEAGWHTLMPCLHPLSDEWREDWMPGLWAPTLLDEPDSPYQAMSAAAELDASLEGFIWKRTAGVPRYVARLRSITTEVALRAKLRCISQALVDQVYRLDPRMRPLHTRIEAITNSRWQSLESFEDMPIELFRALMAPEGGNSSATSEPAPQSTQQKVSKPRRGKGKLNKACTPEAKMRDALKEGLRDATYGIETPRTS